MSTPRGSSRRPDATWSEGVQHAVGASISAAAARGAERYGTDELVGALIDDAPISDLLSSIGFTVAGLREAIAARPAPAEPGEGEPMPDERVLLAIVRAGDAAHELRGATVIEPLDLLAAVLGVESELPPASRGTATRRLLAADLTAEALYEAARPDRPVGAGDDGRGADGERIDLATFTTDLTAEARAGRLDPMIGRERELARVVSILSRRTKNNPVVIGDAGVGKSAIAEGIAQAIVAGTVPEGLRGATVVSLSPGRMVAGTTYRGQFEARVAALIDAIDRSPSTILFIDELQMIIGAGTSSANESGDLANMLKPAIARGDLRLLGATTREEYRRFVERDPAIERRFTPVEVDEPTRAETRAILAGIAGRYGEHHGVRYAASAIETAIDLADRHFPSRRFPDKAIDLLDEAGARAGNAGRRTVGNADVAAVVSERLGTPVGAAATDPADAMEAAIRAAAPVHAAAARRIARLIAARRAGISERRGAIAVVVVVGPAESDAAAFAAAVADAAFGGQQVVIDGTAVADASAAWQLTGVPAGFAGHDQPAKLVDPLRHHAASLVTLLRADAASRQAIEVIAEAARTGTARDAAGRSASWRHAVLLLTVERERLSGGIGFTADGAASPAAIRRLIDDLGAVAPLVDAVMELAAPSAADLAAVARERIAVLAAGAALRGLLLSLDPSVPPHLAAGADSAAAVRRRVAEEVEPVVAAALYAGEPAEARLVVADGVLALEPTAATPRPARRPRRQRA
jgi:ATP-dependent Clp protease ATP-binding subunit ClpA